MLNEFDLNTSSICRRKRFCDRKYCRGNERKQIISILLKKTVFFALEIVILNNGFANVDAFKHIFYNYKKGVDYKSSNLDILAESFRK